MVMTSRAALVAHLRDRFERERFPRLTVTAIVSLAGLVAFLSSVACLRAGIVSMGLRYGIATLAGYAAFLVLVRVWIALQRGWEPPSELVPDFAIDVPDLLGVGTTHVRKSTSTHVEVMDGSAVEAVGSGLSLDLDEWFLVVLLILVVLGGFFALGYVVYAAPALLAEVALDAALVSSVSRRLRREEAGSWAGAVVRRTALPAGALTAFVSMAGFAFQQIAPEAHSIGAVIRAIVS
jgi:hypothetical protein